MNFDGIVVSVVTLVIIGLFHPIVVKAEYYFSKRIWPVFLVFGCICIIASILVKHFIISSLVSITGACSWWSIKELFEQEVRVDKGWFPAGPGHKKKGEKNETKI